MKNVEMKIDALEQIVILNALKHAKETKFFSDVEASHKKRGTVSLVAWRNLADRLELRLEEALR